MTSTKSILTAFWKFVDDYDGDISCHKAETKGDATFYKVVTDGNTFDAVVHEGDPDIVFFRGEGIVGGWRCTDGLPVVELDGVPYIAPEVVPARPMTVSELAKASGKTVSSVYYHAKALGRLPTLEELKAAKTGPKRKYF